MRRIALLMMAALVVAVGCASAQTPTPIVTPTSQWSVDISAVDLPTVQSGGTWRQYIDGAVTGQVITNPLTCNLGACTPDAPYSSCFTCIWLTSTFATGNHTIAVTFQANGFPETLPSNVYAFQFLTAVTSTPKNLHKK